jgi:hypothetical protein
MKTQLLTAALLVSLSACSMVYGESSELLSDLRNTGDFYGVVVNGNANVILSQGQQTSVKIEGDSRAIGSLKTEVSNGALVISGENVRSVNVYVTVDDINLVEVNGSARVYAAGPINSDLILLKVNGSGSIRMDVRSLSLGMIVKGSGKIVASGSTGDSYTRVYGKGNVYATNLDYFRSTEEVNNGKVAFIRESDGNEKRMTLKLHN